MPGTCAPPREFGAQFPVTGFGEQKGICPFAGIAGNTGAIGPLSSEKSGATGSTPVVWGDYIFVSTPDDNRNLLLLCLDRKTGAVKER